jgi:hypothetical protein
VKIAWFCLAAVLLLLGCGKNIQSQEAVRQAVIDHLSGRPGLDVASMQVDVTSVVFRDDEADATVSFRPKGSTAPGSGMQMNYTLERKGNHWVVKSRSDAGGSPHGAGAMPGAGGGGLPPGHPPVGETPSPGKTK